jgi:hypothetical protein
MNISMPHLQRSQIKNGEASWILLGIPVVFSAGSLLHFAYEWSGRLQAIASFVPVNESIWEHLKLAFWPLLIWWFAGIIITGKKRPISAVSWFVAEAVAQLVCPLVIMAFYYTYTGALGIKSLFLDIVSFLLGLTVGQGLALHFYRYVRLKRFWFYGAIIVLIIMAIAFTVFTFVPPKLLLFQDPQTGKYGI